MAGNSDDGAMMQRIEKADYESHEWLMEVARADLISLPVRIAAGGKAAQQLMEHRYAMDLYSHSNDERLPPEVRKTMADAAEAVLSRDTDSELSIRDPKKLEKVLDNRKASPKTVAQLAKSALLLRGMLDLKTRRN